MAGCLVPLGWAEHQGLESLNCAMLVSKQIFALNFVYTPLYIVSFYRIKKNKQAILDLKLARRFCLTNSTNILHSLRQGRLWDEEALPMLNLRNVTDFVNQYVQSDDWQS